MDPGVRLLEAFVEADLRLPSEVSLDERIVAGSAPHSLRGVELVPAAKPHAGDLLHDCHKLVDGQEVGTADVDWLGDVALHQELGAIDAIVDEHEAARLLAVAPDLD